MITFAAGMAMRIGVSARLAKTAAAALGDKDPHELELMRLACDVTFDVFRAVFASFWKQATRASIADATLSNSATGAVGFGIGGIFSDSQSTPPATEARSHVSIVVMRRY